jgi:hypothetical protein
MQMRPQAFTVIAGRRVAHVLRRSEEQTRLIARRKPMNRLLRPVIRELRYRPVTELIGERIQISGLDAVVGGMLLHLASKVPWPLRFKGPGPEEMTICAVKYGILDLTFAIDGLVVWCEGDAPGLPLLKEFGFVQPREPGQGKGTFECNDLTCITELYNDIQKREALLRVFLWNGDDDHTKKLIQRFGMKELMKDFMEAETLEKYLHVCFPGEFTITDSCLTNAEFIWIHKHFYL